MSILISGSGDSSILCDGSMRDSRYGAEARVGSGSASSTNRAASPPGFRYARRPHSHATASTPNETTRIGPTSASSKRRS